MKNWGNRSPKFNNWKIQILRVISGELKKGLKFDLMHFRSSEMVLMKAGKPLQKNKTIAMQSGTWESRSGRGNEHLISPLKLGDLSTYHELEKNASKFDYMAQIF